VESELELRDLTPQMKSTQSKNVKHFEIACIGSEQCFKQKSIEKLFVDGLILVSKSITLNSTIDQNNQD
jgi:hypothetical protein